MESVQDVMNRPSFTPLPFFQLFFAPNRCRLRTHRPSPRGWVTASPRAAVEDSEAEVVAAAAAAAAADSVDSTADASSSKRGYVPLDKFHGPVFCPSDLRKITRVCASVCVPSAEKKNRKSKMEGKQKKTGGKKNPHETSTGFELCWRANFCAAKRQRSPSPLLSPFVAGRGAESRRVRRLDTRLRKHRKSSAQVFLGQMDCDDRRRWSGCGTVRWRIGTAGSVAGSCGPMEWLVTWVPGGGYYVAARVGLDVRYPESRCCVSTTGTCPPTGGAGRLVCWYQPRVRQLWPTTTAMGERISEKKKKNSSDIHASSEVAWLSPPSPVLTHHHLSFFGRPDSVLAQGI